MSKSSKGRRGRSRRVNLDSNRRLFEKIQDTDIFHIPEREFAREDLSLRDRRVFVSSLKRRLPLRKEKRLSLSSIHSVRLYTPYNVIGRLATKTPVVRDVVKRWVCASRRIRAEVLHALKKTGKGKGRKPPRLTWRSDIKCK